MEIQQFNDLMIVGAMRCADCNDLRRLRRKILRLYKAKRPKVLKKSLRENGEALNAIKSYKLTQTFSSRHEESNYTNFISHICLIWKRFVQFLPAGH